MDDETKEALERAAELMSSPLWHEDTHKDAALIRAHIRTSAQRREATIAALGDHKRGCEGRAYTCTCGYDDALIRAHIASEDNAHDAGYAAAVADVVAWLCCDEDVARLWRAMKWSDGAKSWLADKIEAGEHVGAAKGGDDASI